MRERKLQRLASIQVKRRFFSGISARNGGGRVDDARKNTAELEALIDAHGDDILRLCVLVLGDRQLGEDAFQETMLKAWKALGTFRGECSPRTWLSHIAVNTCRDMTRRGWFRLWRKSVGEEALAQIRQEPPETHGEVTAAVLALPPKYREVIVLYYYEEMKVREIAHMLKQSVNSVSTRLRRGRALLAQTLKEDIADE